MEQLKIVSIKSMKVESKFFYYLVVFINSDYSENLQRVYTTKEVCDYLLSNYKHLEDIDVTKLLVTSYNSKKNCYCLKVSKEFATSIGQ